MKMFGRREMKDPTALAHARLISVWVIAATLAGCGGGGSAAPTSAAAATPAKVAAPTGAAATATTPAATAATSTSATQPTSGSGADNSAPQIFGVAATTAKVGQSYSFQPSAKDADNRALTFSLSGAPSWLTFDPATGRISGTPSGADVGTDKAILLEVSDGISSVSLAPFSITVLAAGSSGGNISLSWAAPADNTNGSALVNLSGYVIHYGNVPNVYTSSITIDNPGLTSYVVEDLPPGTYYFSMTSTTTSGAHSSPSAEASTTIT
jgi:Putative Ig domain